jgi:hypothetical protein
MNGLAIYGTTNGTHRSFGVKSPTDNALDVLFQCQDACSNPYGVPVVSDGIFQSLLDYAVHNGQLKKHATRRNGPVKHGKRKTRRRTMRRS